MNSTTFPQHTWTCMATSPGCVPAPAPPPPRNLKAVSVIVESKKLNKKKLNRKWHLQANLMPSFYHSTVKRYSVVCQPHCKGQDSTAGGNKMGTEDHRPPPALPGRHRRLSGTQQGKKGPPWPIAPWTQPLWPAALWQEVQSSEATDKQA